MADVEDKYPITWVPGESITVHLDERDVVFVRRSKMWVGDFSDWIVSDEDRLQELHTDLSLMTVREKEDLYTRREVRKALEAGEFLKSLGYPTQKEALGIVRDGNVKNIPYTANDINRFFDIYGPQVAGVRGRTMKRTPSNTAELDQGAKMQLTFQEMSADIMHVGGYRAMVSVNKPLGLTLIDSLSSLTKNELGRSLQSHINTLRSRGFEPTHIYVDPQRGLEALQGSFPGVEVDTSGAGDHLVMVDTRIRRIKEIMRAVIAGLPYRLHHDRMKDLAKYAVNRTNLKSTQGLISKESPRVRFTGRKPAYKAEFGLSFGDYVESYNPRAEAKSNDVTVARTEPCIALYPSANRNGSWIMWNLSTKAYVRRTQWKKLPFSERVIDIMNDIAGDRGIKLADILEEDAEPMEIEGGEPRLHRPDNQEMNIPAAEENEACNEELNMPELIDQCYEDSDSESSEPPEELFGEEDADDEEQAGINAILEDIASDGSSQVQVEPVRPVRRTQRETAGKQRYDDAYDWNLMNLSVGAAIRNFGDVA
jgi:hypothetical protein